MNSILQLEPNFYHSNSDVNLYLYKLYLALEYHFWKRMLNSPCQDCKRQVWQTACHHGCTPLGDNQGCYGSRYPWRWWSSGWQSGVSDELIQNLIIWAAGSHPRVCLNCEPNTKTSSFQCITFTGHLQMCSYGFKVTPRNVSTNNHARLCSV